MGKVTVNRTDLKIAVNTEPIRQKSFLGFFPLRFLYFVIKAFQNVILASIFRFFSRCRFLFKAFHDVLQIIIEFFIIFKPIQDFFQMRLLLGRDILQDEKRSEAHQKQRYYERTFSVHGDVDNPICDVFLFNSINSSDQMTDDR